MSSLKKGSEWIPKALPHFQQIVGDEEFFFVCNSSLVVSYIIINLRDYKGVYLLKNVGMCC